MTMKKKELLTSISKEIEIQTCGLRFICVVGLHKGGGYAAFVNYGLCSELSVHDDDINYNTERIFQTFSMSKNVYLSSPDNYLYSISKTLSEEITPVVCGIKELEENKCLC